MELEFKTLTMMELRSSPGEILDRVYKNGESFIIERNGRQKACLVPIWHFLPDIPKDIVYKVNEELDVLRQKGEKPLLTFTDNNELEILFKEACDKCEITLKIVLPHGYPNNAPKVYASPIISDTPHRWQDGALCIFGAMTNWNPGKHNIASVLTLARKWLSGYGEWQNKGRWPDKVEGNK
jgi:hypothetical protein